ncbi:docking protein 1 [Trichonephila clavata]|uniref:Docking protein 1 n=1 Tax=Trichonephila clavata TaxID=2740835 RepID=A0A8X6KA06_TRICU|nr:docking protein 1 [Trichonephila clavata]
MEMEEALKVGFLFIPPHNFLRKTWLKRYCALYNASNHGIQRIELFETEEAYVKQNPSKIIPLTDCWKVTPLPQKHQSNVFEVRTKSNSYQFSADTFQEMSEWLVSLQNVAFYKAQMKTLVPTIPTNEEKQEENLLYCSMDEPEIYSVKAVATEAVLRNNLKGDYKLIITSVNFSIAEECSLGRIGRVILTWPYRHIRRYGCSTESFSFEAGRKCASGEGLFTFATTDGMKIFQSVDSHVSALKSTQGDIEIPNSPSIKEDKNNCFTSKDSLNSNDSAFSETLNKSEHSFPSPLGINNESISSHKSNLKSLPPFSKPPRKSKSSAYSSCSDKSSKANNISVQDSPITEIPSKSPHFSLCSNVGDTSIASHVPNKMELSSCFENVKINEIPKKDVKVKRAHSTYNYENCDFGFDYSAQSSRPAFTAEHTYGKLSNARQSAPLNTGNIYGSIITNASMSTSTSPVYCNIPYLKQSGVISGDEQDPEHFLKNDAEYAQVLKKNKNVS